MRITGRVLVDVPAVGGGLMTPVQHHLVTCVQLRIDRRPYGPLDWLVASMRVGLPLLLIHLVMAMICHRGTLQL